MRAPFQILVIPFRRRPAGLEFAVLKRGDSGYWQFVAGGGEYDETPVEAARRETNEEAGIAGDMIALDSCCTVPKSCFGAADSWDDGVFVIPEHCFAIDVGDRDLCLSEEHTGSRWVSFAQACGLLKWDSNRNALWELNERLRAPSTEPEATQQTARLGSSVVLKEMTTDFSKLIPELKHWNNGDGIDVESWIECIGSFQKAIGYSTMFWPEFDEVEGCVVLASVPAEDVRLFLRQCDGDKRCAEATMNHLHVVGLQHLGCADVTPERVAYLGRILREMYECKLKRDFPDKAFVVAFDEPDDREDVEGYILTFCQDEKNRPSHRTA